MNGRISDMFRNLSFSFKRCPKFFKFNRSRPTLIWRRSLTLNRILFRTPVVRSKIKIGLGLGLISGLSNYGVLAEWDPTNTFIENKEDMEHVYTGKILHPSQTFKMLKWFSHIQPYSVDLEMDMDNITKIFVKKVNMGEDAMSAPQFFRWLQFYLRAELSEEDRLIWKTAFARSFYLCA